MIKRGVSSFLALALVAVWAMTLSGLHAQSSKAMPRAADGKPDFSGVYEWPKAASGERCKCSATIFDRNRFAPLKPGGEPFFEKPNGDPRHDEPRNFCMPAGFPSGMLSANAVQFVQNKNYLVIVHEFQRMTRIIPLDGRPHRKGLEPMYYGDSVGHWEGDTLVVDSAGFNDKVWLDVFGHPVSESLRIQERFHRRDFGHMDLQITITDPKMYSKPIAFKVTELLMPDSDIFEYFCNENEKDRSHIDTK